MKSNKIKVLGNINKKTVEKAVKKVEKALGEIKGIEIFVFDDPKYCRELKKELPKQIGEQFEQICLEEETSLSLSADNYHRIIIHITEAEEYMKTDFNAFVGVLMHEYMHTILRLRGLDEEVEQDAVEAFREFQEKHQIFKSNKFKKAYLLEMYSDIGRNATLTLLDYYVNMELIDRGFGKFILEDYSRLYHKRKAFITLIPKIQLEREPKDAAMGMGYLLNILSALVPFGRYYLMNKNKEAKELANFIEKNYLPKVGIIAPLAEPLIDYSVDKFAWNSRFRKEYYEKVFQLAYNLVM